MEINTNKELNNKVSIIVPIYNSEQFLNRCINSLISQTYDNLEIILVNDGSKDNSLQLCNNFKDQDNRIIIVNKENGGLSSARNAGLNIATGDYVAFVDSDDYVDSRMIETLVHLALEYSVDAAQMKWTEFYSEPDFRYSNNHILVDNKIQEFLLKDNNLYCVVRYLFKKSIIGNYRFDENMKMAEDQKFNFDVLKNIDKIAVTDYCGYFYFQNGDSMSNGVVKDNHFYDIKYRQELVDSIEDKGLNKLAKAHLLKAYLAFYMKALVYGYKSSENIIQNYGKIVRKNYINYLILPNIDIKRKIAATCSLFGDKFMKTVSKKVLK